MAFLYKIARKNKWIPDPKYIKDPFWNKVVSGADYVNELVQPVRSFAQNAYFGTDLPTTLDEIPEAAVKAGLSHVTGGLPVVEDAKNAIDFVKTISKKRPMDSGESESKRQKPYPYNGPYSGPWQGKNTTDNRIPTFPPAEKSIVG